MESSPFNEAERALQTRVGVRDKIELQGQRVIRGFLTEQHQQFFAMLPFIVISSLDSQQRQWTQFVCGNPGFIDTSDCKLVRIHSLPTTFELVIGAPIGILGIQLHTRRRNKVKGTVVAVGKDGFDVKVFQTCGNCPQYIFSREAEFVRDAKNAPSSQVLIQNELDDRAVDLISKSDFFFLGTVEADKRAAEVNHRGGKSGFVKVRTRRELIFPDFTGNFHFSSLGNISATGAASAIFVDTETSEPLLLTCKAEIDWDSELLKSFAGAERLVKLTILEIARPSAPLPIKFSGGVPSNILFRTGDWNAAEKSLEASKTRNIYYPFVVTSVEAENQSGTIVSIVLEPRDAKSGVPIHVAGQFLPIRVKGLSRTYTISDCPNNHSYRLSVKREGEVSSLLHSLSVGDSIDALAPRGDFVFDYEKRRPVIFFAAGVGITPFVAMVNEIFINEGRTRHHQNVFLFHSVNSLSNVPFLHHFLRKQQMHGNFHYLVNITGAGEKLPSAPVFQAGRLTKETLQTRLPLDDYEVYICGPQSFQQSMYNLVLSLGIRDERVHAESFGPSALRRERPVKAKIASTSTSASSEEGVLVHFSKSNVTARWTGSGTLLELAESAGLNPSFSCRSGICGTCAVKCKSGKVEYLDEPMAQLSDIEDVLLCCSRPKPGAHVDGGKGKDREGVILDL